METFVTGVKNEKKEMERLILEIYDYRDKMSEILNTAESLVYNTKNYYASEDGEKLREKFNEFSSNFSVVLGRIKQYGKDLEDVLTIYKKNSLKNVDVFKK